MPPPGEETAIVWSGEWPEERGILLDDFLALLDNDALEVVVHALAGYIVGRSVGIGLGADLVQTGCDADEMAARNFRSSFAVLNIHLKNTLYNYEVAFLKVVDGFFGIFCILKVVAMIYGERVRSACLISNLEFNVAIKRAV